MAIKVGDRLPEGSLTELVEAGATPGPTAVSVKDGTKGKRIAVFGVPGAFTPT
jgi:peroxiredoxin